jgi:hypothetical protein
MSKLLALPYPQMIDQMQVLEQRLAKEHEARTNPFLNLIPTLSRAVKGFAYSDREMAALTAVEAIRSYAAANGRLPDTLDEITETPVPLNPVTGSAFEYGLDGDEAVIRDTQSADRPLEFRVKLQG